MMRLLGKRNSAVLLTGCCSWDRNDVITCEERKGSVTHLLLIMGWDMMKLPCKRKNAVTHRLLVMENEALRLHWKKNRMQSHSHTVGYRIKHDESANETNVVHSLLPVVMMTLWPKKECSIAHILVVEWQYMMRPLGKGKNSVTHILLSSEAWWDFL